MLPIKKYEVVVIAGGGLKTCLSLGALDFAHHVKCLVNVKHYIGTSAGALIGFLLIIGMKPIHIFEEILSVDVSHHDKALELMLQLGTSFGLFDCNILRMHLYQVLDKVNVRRSITLRELAGEYSASLTCVVYNMSTGTPMYISDKTHPDLECVDAVLMSSCIPIYFKPMLYKSEYYVDGGIYDNFPIDYALTTHRGKVMLGVITNAPAKGYPTDVFDYIGTIATIYTGTAKVLRHLEELTRSNPNVHILNIDNSLIPLPYVSVTDKRLDLVKGYLYGYEYSRHSKVKLD